MELSEIQRRMHSGELYACSDSALQAEQEKALDLLYDFNHTRPSEGVRRQELLKEMFAEIGENCYLEPPFYANWGGRHVHFGDGVYANFHLTLVDDSHIYVGDRVLFGPNVTVCAGTHPVHPALRAQQVQYNLPIRIEKDVWIGGGTFILPGVTIGENSVIGAGSVVTKDIPANVVAVGNPCRVLRPIDQRDDKFYDHDKEIDWSLWR